MRPWLTFPLLFLGLLFLLMPFWIALGDAALWTWYGMGLFWAVVIGLFAGRWLRVTTVERVDHPFRGANDSGCFVLLRDTRGDLLGDVVFGVSCQCERDNEERKGR